jgi:hypothetical protein
MQHSAHTHSVCTYLCVPYSYVVVKETECVPCEVGSFPSNQKQQQWRMCHEGDEGHGGAAPGIYIRGFCIELSARSFTCRPFYPLYGCDRPTELSQRSRGSFRGLSEKFSEMAPNCSNVMLPNLSSWYAVDGTNEACTALVVFTNPRIIPRGPCHRNVTLVT